MQWLNTYLSKEEITDICINGTEGGFFDDGTQGYKMTQFSCCWKEEEIRRWSLEKLSEVGKSWDAKYPFVDAVIHHQQHSFRIHIIFPPVAQQGTLISLRRIRKNPKHLTRWAHSALFPFLQEAAIYKRNILIAGATGSGKTTLTSDLLQNLPSTERIVALEDTAELSPVHGHFVSLLSRPPNSDGHGEVTLRMLLKQTLRMRPDRIVLGECRGNEVLDLLQALNTGHRGLLTTVHANSARDALRRLELLCLLACNGQISASVLRDLIAHGLDLIAFVGKRSDRSDFPVCRDILEIWQLDGREGETILLRPILTEISKPLLPTGVK